MATGRKLTSYHLYAVVWDDAWGEDAQMTLHEIESKQARAQRFTTFGLMIKENEQGVVLAGELEEDGAFRHVMFIPAGMIVEKVDLGVPTRKIQRTSRKRKDDPLSSSPKDRQEDLPPEPA